MSIFCTLVKTVSWYPWGHLAVWFWALRISHNIRHFNATLTKLMCQAKPPSVAFWLCYSFICHMVISFLVPVACLCGRGFLFDSSFYLRWRKAVWLCVSLVKFSIRDVVWWKTLSILSTPCRFVQKPPGEFQNSSDQPTRVKWRWYYWLPQCFALTHTGNKMHSVSIWK